MSSWYKHIIVLLNVLFLINCSFAQLSGLDSKLKGKTNFKEITEAINEHIKAMPEGLEKYKLKKHFARWSYYQSIHLGSDGELVNISEKTIEAVNNKEVNASRSANGSWYFVGPSTTNNENPSAVFNGIGRVDRIAFHPTNPNIIYIGTPAGGLWKTTDGGSNWTPLSNYIPSLGISGIVVDYSNTNRIYVLTGAGDSQISNGSNYFNRSVGVLVSHDGGQVWEQTGQLSPNIFNGYRLVQSPADPLILFAVTTDGIYKTKNGGDDWVNVKGGKFYDIDFKPGDPLTIYASGVSDFYYSADTGNFWHQASFDYALCNKRIEFAVTPANSNLVYLIAGNTNTNNTFCGFFKSIDSGRNFVRQTNSPNIIGKEDGSGNDQSNYDLAITASPTNSQIVLTGGLIVWKTINGGSVFNNVTSYNENGSDWYIHPDVHDLAYNPINGTLYAATDGGFYSSIDNGATWNDHIDGISTTQIYHMDDYNNDENIIMIGNQDNGVKYRNTNTSYFSNIGSGDGFDVAINYSDQTKGWAVFNTSIKKYTHFLDDPYLEIDSDSFFPQLECHTSNPEKIYYSWDTLYAYDGGSPVMIGNGLINGYNALKTCPSNSNRIYAAGGYNQVLFTGKFYESDDGGISWDTVSNNTGFPAVIQRVTDIGVNPTNSARVYICYGGYTDSQKVYYSSNAGDSWSNYSFDLPNTPIWSIEVDASNNLYVGTDIGVFYKPTTSNNWEPYYNNLPNVPISDLAINEAENQLLAATFGRGVWKSTLKSSCSANYTTSATLEGNYFIGVSTDINTTSTIDGGAGTNVIFRAGHNVILNPGFEANGEPGNKFTAYIGDCESGLPTDMSTGETIFPVEFQNYNISLSRNKGTLEIIEKRGQEVDVLARIFGKGYKSIKVFISDLSNNKLTEVSTIKKPNHENIVTINNGITQKGNYMFYLVIDGEVTHLQEFQARVHKPIATN